MNGSKPGSRNSRRRRIKVAPVTRAVRIALAASAAAFALAGSGAAFAQSCTDTPPSTTLCDGAFIDPIDIASIDDLTLVVGSVDPTSSVIPQYSGDTAITVFSGGNAYVDNHAYLSTAYAPAIQAYAQGSLSIDNSGDINAYDGWGIDAQTVDGDLTIVNTGDVYANGDVNGGTIAAVVGFSTYGDISNSNDGNLHVYGYDMSGGVVSYAISGNASAANTGSIDVESYGGTATGAYAYSLYADAAVSNEGTIKAASWQGIGDGMFASGANVTASNGDHGYIYSYGYDWTAGIEARGDYSAEVSNDGVIGAYLRGEEGQATGIYASGGAGGVSIVNNGEVNAFVEYAATAIGIAAATDGGDIDIDNHGAVTAKTSIYGGNAIGIQAVGNYDGSDVAIANHGEIEATVAYAYGQATGIDATATGNVAITNAGVINAQAPGGLAAGIHAASTYSGGNANVVNDGSIYAHGYYGGTGIDVLAVGEGGSATVTNTGYVDVTQDGFVGYGANGIMASGDLDATVGNSGDIRATSNGMGYGIAALAFNGTASVTNTGDIGVDAVGAGYTGAYGMVASSSNGAAVVDNSGEIHVSSYYYGHGISASGTTGSTVTNSGSVTSDAWIGYGILATAGLGDVSVTNTDEGVVSAYYSVANYYGQAFGIAGISTAGDVAIRNDGHVSADLGGRAAGIAALASGGTVAVVNTGSVEVHTSGDLLLDPVPSGQATGILAHGAAGAAVSNDGSVYVQSEGKYARAVGVYGSTYIADDAGTAGDVSISTGLESSITAVAQQDYGFGIYGVSSTGVVSIDNAGSVYAAGGIGGIGLKAVTVAGAITIDNSGDIQAGAGGIAAGMFAQSYDGAIALSNNASVQAYTLYGPAAGMSAYSGNGDVSLGNTGSLDVESDGNAAMGMYAYSGYGQASVTNADGASVTASAESGIANGITAFGDSVVVSNAGTIAATGHDYAYGVFAVGAHGVTLTNDGDINADAYRRAYGAWVDSSYGDVTVNNSGTIEASSHSTNGAWGVVAYAYNTLGEPAGDVHFNNVGTIDATSGWGYVTGATARGAGVDFDSSGHIDADSTYSWAFGAKLEATVADLDAVNSGTISVQGYGEAAGMLATSYYGNAAAENGGTITAESGYGWGIGIQAAGSTGVSADNTGSITASGVTARGLDIYAMNNGEGDALIVNAGDITATSTDNRFSGLDVIGASAVSSNALASVENSGTILSSATIYGDGAGIYVAGGSTYASNSGSVTASATNGVAHAIVGYGRDEVEIHNTGEASVQASGLAVGLGAYADTYPSGSSSLVVNDGDVHAESSGYMAAGIYATGTDVEVGGGAGSIDVYGYEFGAGIQAYSPDGSVIVDTGNTITVTGYVNAAGIDARAATDVSVAVAGDITAMAVDGHGYPAFGISASGGGTASVDVGSTLTASSPGDATGVFVSGDGGASASVTGGVAAYSSVQAIGLEVQSDLAASLNNSGHIMANGEVSAEGASVTGTTAGLINSGSIEAQGNGAKGVALRGDQISLENSGSIDAEGQLAMGMTVSAGSGGFSGTNSGSIAAISTGGAKADALLAYSEGDIDFTSSGSIDASTEEAGARGALFVTSGAIDALNSGSITAIGDTADAMFAVGVSGGVGIHNSGSIGAEGATQARAIYAMSYFGGISVANSGTVSASAADSAVALATGYATAVDVTNSGTIAASGAGEGNIAVLASYAALSLSNTGTINGAIVTYSGDDLIENGAHGTWNVTNHATDFGDGANVLHNLVGGTVALAGGAIYFGDGAENSFVNDGTITVTGDNSIHMSGSSNQAFGPLAMSIVPMDAPPTPFENNGIIDFADGNATDILTITGDFAGQGDINLDVNLLNGTSDLLYIDGDVVDGTQQTVNLSVDDIGDVVNPTPAQFLSVSGNVANGAFIPGEVTGFGIGNFIDLGVQLTPSTQNGTTVFSASVAVAGLNSTGVLAANILPGAQQLIASSIGTLRQRNGTGAGPGQVGAWLRVFDNDGDVNPAHTQDFGSAGDFGFSQSNHGTELGVGYDLDGPLQFGVMFGKSDATQKMRDGSGSDHFKLNTAGVYGTWAVPAFYVDASYRRMSFDARLNSSAGEQDTSGDADAWNFEAGYTGWSFGGLNVIPQVQYTIARVDGVDPVKGSIADFDSSDSTSERSRLGVEINRSFQAGAVAWTPYLAASTVHESDGKASYTIADTFSGTTDTGGSSTLLEAGVGAQVGAFRATLGANWADGGAQDGITGGQLVLRYNW